MELTRRTTKPLVDMTTQLSKIGNTCTTFVDQYQAAITDTELGSCMMRVHAPHFTRFYLIHAMNALEYDVNRH